MKRLVVRSKNETDIEVCSEGELSAKGSQASLTISRLSSQLSLEKFRMKSDGRFLAEASLRTSPISKFIVCAEDGRQEPGKPLQSFGKLGCEILLPNPRFGVIADIDVVNGPLFRLAALYRPTTNLSIGLESLVNSHLEDKDQSPEVVDLNICMNYRGPGWSVSSRSFDSLSSLRVSYIHTVSPTVTVGSQLDYRLRANSQRLMLGTQVTSVNIR